MPHLWDFYRKWGTWRALLAHTIAKLCVYHRHPIASGKEPWDGVSVSTCRAAHQTVGSMGFVLLSSIHPALLTLTAGRGDLQLLPVASPLSTTLDALKKVPWGISQPCQHLQIGQRGYLGGVWALCPDTGTQHPEGYPESSSGCALCLFGTSSR